MSTYLIGYDLNRPRGQDDYPNLTAAIRAFGTYWHHLDSTWIIKSNQTAVQIRDALMTHIDSGDELLVVELSGAAAWTGFTSEASVWLKDNL